MMIRAPSCDSKTPDNLIGLEALKRGEGTDNTDAPGHQCINTLSEQDSA